MKKKIKNISFSEAIGKEVGKVCTKPELMIVIIISSAVSALTSFVLSEYGTKNWNEIVLPTNVLVNAVIFSAIGLFLVVATIFLGIFLIKIGELATPKIKKIIEIGFGKKKTLKNEEKMKKLNK